MFGFRLVAILAVLGVASTAQAHVAAYHKGMYCRNGLSTVENENSAEVSQPLYNVSFSDFWMRGKCKDFPPVAGNYLDLPAGGKVTLEISGNRGQTTLSFDGKYAGQFPDGKSHPEYDNGTWNNTCIGEPNMHTENRTRAAGTVLALAYQSNIYNVKYEDLVVISVAAQTPWYRLTQYDIPADLQACSDCVCAWAWIPNGCGTPNAYMNPFKCRVTGAKANAPKLAKAQPARWCEGKPADCVKGAKGITIFNQQTAANTIDLKGKYQADGLEASPGYNNKMGFSSGAQRDIFVTSTTTSASTTTKSTSSTTTSKPASTTSKPASTTTSKPASTTIKTTSATSTPTATCGGTKAKRHLRKQRRLLSFAGFHLSMDARGDEDGEEL